MRERHTDLISGVHDEWRMNIALKLRIETGNFFSVDDDRDTDYPDNGNADAYSIINSVPLLNRYGITGF